MPFYSTLLSSVLFPPALTLVGQLLLHRPEGLGHVLVLSWARPRAPGPSAHRQPANTVKPCWSRRRARSKPKPLSHPVISTPWPWPSCGGCSLRCHTALTKSNSSSTETERQPTAWPTRRELLMVEVWRRSSRLDVLRTGGLQVWSSGRLEVCLPAGLGTPPTIYKAGREHQRALCCV